MNSLKKVLAFLKGPIAFNSYLLVNQLAKKEWTIASCESFTGGLFSSAITDTPGASQVFKGGIVAYSNEVKQNVVKVNEQTIKKYGVISKECALEMAQNAKELFQTNISISFTGNAGPHLNEDKPKGLAFMCLIINDEVEVIELMINHLSRVDFKKQAVKLIFKKINKACKK